MVFRIESFGKEVVHKEITLSFGSRTEYVVHHTTSQYLHVLWLKANGPSRFGVSDMVSDDRQKLVCFPLES